MVLNSVEHRAGWIRGAGLSTGQRSLSHLNYRPRPRQRTLLRVELVEMGSPLFSENPADVLPSAYPTSLVVRITRISPGEQPATQVQEQLAALTSCIDEITAEPHIDVVDHQLGAVAIANYTLHTHFPIGNQVLAWTIENQLAVATLSGGQMKSQRGWKILWKLARNFRVDGEAPQSEAAVGVSAEGACCSPSPVDVSSEMNPSR